jgi:hypothetical protein
LLPPSSKLQIQIRTREAAFSRQCDSIGEEESRGSPIDEVCSTASPANSSITGMGGVILTPSVKNKKKKKRKKNAERE